MVRGDDYRDRQFKTAMGRLRVRDESAGIARMQKAASIGIGGGVSLGDLEFPVFCNRGPSDRSMRRGNHGRRGLTRIAVNSLTVGWAGCWKPLGYAGGALAGIPQQRCCV